MIPPKKIGIILNEYGLNWAVNRFLYSAKLRAMKLIPWLEKYYEAKPVYSKRLDLFQINVEELTNFINGIGKKEFLELIEIADEACNGIVNGFSSIKLDYGVPMDWQLNPLTGKRTEENQKWYKIRDFDTKRGDIKIIWEASRFSHFISFARAYLITGNKKYYIAFSTQLKDWLTNNKYGYGANFKCGQECSLRMVNALLAYSVFKKCGCTTDADESNMKDLIDRCYRKILSNFSYAYKCIKNNHTISEIMGMIVGAWCCEDLSQLAKGYHYLNEVIDEQFTPDGGYSQFSFNYQRLVMQDLECILSIVQKTGYDISNDNKKKLLNAVLLLYQCQDLTGDVPNYGSNDGALIFPVTSCNYRDFKPIINSMYAMLTGKQLFNSGIHQEELIWFSDGKRLCDYDNQVIKRKASQFKDAGIFTLRNQDSFAIIIANNYKSRPGHMDQLHFDMWIDGINVFCDLGTYSYASVEGKELSKNISHNTAIVENVNQMNSIGPFMTYGWTKRKIFKHVDNCFSAAIITNTGYIHRRTVKTDGISYYINDSVNKDYKILFHTPCDVKIFDGKAFLYHNGKLLCKLICDGGIEVSETFRSLYYLKKEPVRLISITGRAGKIIKTKIQIVKGEKKND